jgi:predicted dehydrogenase
MNKLKTAIVGCGNISGIYFQNLTSVFKNIEIVACCDLEEEKVKTAAETYHIPSILTLNEALEDEKIDAILNLTTPQSHYEICKKALNAGKHVYVEKPLSLNLAEGRELLEIAAGKELRIGCAPDTFLGAGIQTCIKLIDDGFIGDPVAATAFMTCHGHEGWHPDPEFYYKKGGGPVFDMGPYYLTALVAMLGSVETVCGMSKISFPERVIGSEKKRGEKISVEVPTHVAGILRFTSGAVATLIMSFDIWDSSLPRIEIYGSRATLTAPDPNTFGGPVLLKGKEIPFTHPYDANSRGLGLADMASSIEKGEPARANGEVACHVLEIMSALHESSDTGIYYKMKTTCSRPKPMSRDELI